MVHQIYSSIYRLLCRAGDQIVRMRTSLSFFALPLSRCVSLSVLQFCRWMDSTDAEEQAEECLGEDYDGGGPGKRERRSFGLRPSSADSDISVSKRKMKDAQVMMKRDCGRARTVNNNRGVFWCLLCLSVCFSSGPNFLLGTAKLWIRDTCYEAGVDTVAPPPGTESLA